MTHFLPARPSTLSLAGTSLRPRTVDEVMTMNDMLLRRQEVERIVGLSRSSIYRLMQDEDFPRPVRVCRSAVRWKESDVKVWLESRPVTES